MLRVCEMVEEIGVAFDQKKDDARWRTVASWSQTIESEGYAFVSALQTFAENNGGKIKYMKDTPAML